jgi:hypothetical protein
VKWIAALTTHHKYSIGTCLNWAPFGNNGLAEEAKISKSRSSEFFKKVFGSHAKYRACCRGKDGLVRRLKQLNGDYSPDDLYGDRPPGEKERRHEE